MGPRPAIAGSAIWKPSRLHCKGAAWAAPCYQQAGGVKPLAMAPGGRHRCGFAATELDIMLNNTKTCELSRRPSRPDPLPHGESPLKSASLSDPRALRSPHEAAP